MLSYDFRVSTRIYVSKNSDLYSDTMVDDKIFKVHQLHILSEQIRNSNVTHDMCFLKILTMIVGLILAIIKISPKLSQSKIRKITKKLVCRCLKTRSRVNFCNPL